MLNRTGVPMERIDDWVGAAMLAHELARELGLSSADDTDCRAKLTWSAGPKRRGWRVTVQRLTDGVTMSRFLAVPKGA